MLNDERPVGRLYQYMAPNSKYIESKCPHIPTYMWVRTPPPPPPPPPPHTHTHTHTHTQPTTPQPQPHPNKWRWVSLSLKDVLWSFNDQDKFSPNLWYYWGKKSPPPPKFVVSDPPQPTCTITAIWCCHKFLNQWQCNLQMKAVLPLGNQFATALGCINNTGPWQASPTREAIAPVPLSTTNAPIGTMEGNQE